jgi:hypothetical protein
MSLTFLSGLSWPGNPEKPNDDAFCHGESFAAVFDGATNLGDPILPVDSDAAWIARKGAEALVAYEQLGAREALAKAAAEAERDFVAQRLRVPKEGYEIPYASMMLVAETTGALEFRWFGDCAALVRRPNEGVDVIGEAFASRAAEAARFAELARSKGLSPVAGIDLAQYLPALRASRNRVNTKGTWLFSPDARCAAHAATRAVAAPAGTLVLLCSDGFLALASDYGRYDGDALLAASETRGLRPMFEELRAIENEDADGRRFPRGKKSDDGTAVLLRVT